MNDLLSKSNNSQIQSIKEYSVSELTQNIKKIFEYEFSFIKIKGEISGYKVSPQGHAYFSLKDADSIISVVMFRNDLQSIDIKVEDGQEVLVSGKLTIYKERSNYQIIANSIKLNGVGAILKIIEDRKKKLSLEGLFDLNKKKKIPEFISRVGIVTSATGAAIEDIKSRLTNKFPIQIYLYHSLVQGREASANIIKGIKYFNESKLKCDVLVITRGGGSLEDLMCFNDEDLVRSIFNSNIPTISAVGHEIDWTLSDYVADIRMPTPTSVVDIIAREKEYWHNRIKSMQSFANRKIFEFIDNRKRILKSRSDEVSRCLYFSISKLVQSLSHKINISSSVKGVFMEKLKKITTSLFANKVPSRRFIYNIVSQKIQYIDNMLQIKSLEVNSFSIKHTLNKGFAIVYDDKKFISSAKNLLYGSIYTIEMKDGNRKIKVID